jgi:hypothetical protein
MDLNREDKPDPANVEMACKDFPSNLKKTA